MVVDCPIFIYVLVCKVENDDLNLFDFNIKVVTDNDIEIILGYSNIKPCSIVSITTIRSFKYYLL